MKLETIADIEKWYGPVQLTHANGVFIAVVPLMGGVSIGCGSSVNNAIYDLCCDLQFPESRTAKEPRRQPWEIERRNRIDSARTA